MIYRDLGLTGLKVSQLGFGAMRLPMVGDGDNQRVDTELAVPMIHRAFEAGVNYIDTAIFYCNEDSQRAVGEALKGWRENIIVSTKNHYFEEDEKVWWQNLENSLQRLDVEYIDLYNCHGISWKAWEDAYNPRIRAWFTRAKDQGIIKRICCSFHDNNEALMKLVDTGDFEVITVQYNMLDRQLEEGIAYAYEKGIGVVAMGPVAGGRLGATSNAFEDLVPGIRRVPELALRFVLSNPGISVALSGMSTVQMIEENAAIANDPVTLSAEDQAMIEEQLVRLKKMADLYCSGCGYCTPCPQGVNIPYIFGTYNNARVYDLWDAAREGYACLGTNEWYPGKKADECTDCGTCEDKCPQRLPIREQLKEVHAALTKPKS